MEAATNYDCPNISPAYNAQVAVMPDKQYYYTDWDKCPEPWTVKQLATEPTSDGYTLTSSNQVNTIVGTLCGQLELQSFLIKLQY